ncbi:cytochrome P450 [Aspergillus floccosus]
MGPDSLFLLLPVLLGYVLVLFHALNISRKTKNNIPTVKHSLFLPDWVNRRIFFLNAPAQIQYGSRSHVVTSAWQNILGDYTNILKNSELAGTTVLRKLTPAMNRILPRTMQELQHAFDVEVPPCNDDWVSINPYSVILRLVARVAASFLRPLVSCFIPSVRRLKQQLRWVQDELIVPIVTARRATQDANPDAQKPDDFLQWMMDIAANDIDRDPPNIAQSLLIVTSVGMMHTSTMLITHALYDLLSHPECFDLLRQEIKETLPQGWINATVAAFAAQEKLDSVLRESLRLNPPAEVSTQRIAKEKFTLSDGFTIPDDVQICFPSGPVARDPALLPDAHLYDAFRWCRDPEATNKKLVTISTTNFHFGYGRLACPGRFFSSNTMKAVLSRFIAEYDMRFEREHQERPANLRFGEQIMPSMWTKVLIRRREAKI